MKNQLGSGCKSYDPYFQQDPQLEKTTQFTNFSNNSDFKQDDEDQINC